MACLSAPVVLGLRAALPAARPRARVAAKASVRASQKAVARVQATHAAAVAGAHPRGGRLATGERGGAAGGSPFPTAAVLTQCARL
jgi:hypothetical protein